MYKYYVFVPWSFQLQYTFKYDVLSGPARGWYLKLNDRDDAEPYTLEMSKYFPYSTNDPSREKCKFVIVFHLANIVEYFVGNFTKASTEEY